ncbi:Ni,Fe-hydrogenase III large subunit [Anaerobacterium chartisolvens]|uniref:Ni,Fe-hydrogenase III large subunit n=2 Tax=Anaerobacterium chartisolvens TaxID=1297424 RepID=A0A369B8K1_9FIRM|nr:Ni,Fe-hydrogenase III large subunit [Anaerobacterium chartisolvens]
MMLKLMDSIKEGFCKDIIKTYTVNKNETYIEVSNEAVKRLCMFIYKNIECSLINLFANDEREVNDGFSVYYSFAAKKEGELITVKTTISDTSVIIPSVTLEIPAANLYEREIRDMMGIVFEGHPDMREFVFHENWPWDLHPLQKDFSASRKPPFENRRQDFVRIEGSGVFEIPVGPVHAGIIEPGHFRFSVAGEPVINLEAKLFYVHKGIEKLCEEKHFEKVFFMSERISGDESFSNSLAYCQAIERIAGIYDVPERAAYARTIFCELERLYNHIGDIAGICLDVAYIFANGQFAMMRRWCQMLNEELTGSRFLRSVNFPGGVRREFIKDKEKIVLPAMDRLEKEFSETVDIIKSNAMFIDRVENTGVVSHTLAVELNSVGPAARAAGVHDDARVNFPYAAYDKIKFEVPNHNNGDVNCRMNTKIEEVAQSISIIRQAVELMPSSGGIIEPVESLEPYKHAFGITEAPRGENCHWVMSGENNKIFRYKVRTPSFCNWPVLCHAVKGNIIPDFPLINKSFNLSYSGNDL